MKHTTDDLLDIVYCYYPRGIRLDDERYAETEEDRRLSAARRRAIADRQPWHALLRRMEAQFPEQTVYDGSVHLLTGTPDACYSGLLSLPATAPGEQHHLLAFLVSFLVPYYVVYSSRTADDPDEIERRSKDSTYVFRDGVEVPDTVPKVQATRPTRRAVSLDLSIDEQPYGAWISRELEATFGCERMPPEVGNMIVPDVSTNRRFRSDARLYDCLFSDHW
jgi:hypothetical protein